MAQVQDVPLSPHSSTGDGDSRKGSPDTRLTEPSPKENLKPLSIAQAHIVRSRSENSLQRDLVRRNGSQDMNKDPFVTPAKCTASTLSPTASSFSPFPNFPHDSPTKGSGIVAAALSTDIGVSRHVKITTSHGPLSPSHIRTWFEELESNGKCTHGSRYITSAEYQVDAYFEDIRDACTLHDETNASREGSSKEGWVATYISSENSNKGQSTNADIGYITTGQVMVFATAPAGTIMDTTRAVSDVLAILKSHGRLFAFFKRSVFPDGSFRAVAEYCSTTAAKIAISNGNNRQTINGMQVVITTCQDELLQHSNFIVAAQDSVAQHRTAPTCISWSYGVASPSIPSVTSSELCNSSPFAMYPLLFQSTSSPNLPYIVDSFMGNTPGRGLSAVTDPVSPPYHGASSTYHKPPSPALTVQNGFSPSRTVSSFGRSDHRRQNAARVNRSALQTLTSHHNHVDVNRIRDGIDVRTTIMLRNIPNKVDQAMLKRIVDESSWGKYDFMYLRIDFANDCNVGYAFINFVDPLDIIDFVEARGNQRWNCFKSDKVAEISYATIQGKDCLVQKFRNSSVMLEAAHYRPKLYFTSNGPTPERAGQEEQFPEPDNQSKMKRSCENAEHVGLFTPNAGQHFRDEQRRRRSQYDRGTRLAALEEYDLETAFQHIL